MTHVVPGFSNANEQSFLIHGEDQDKMMQIAMGGGHTEVMFLERLAKQKKKGALGSNLLSVKVNDKTGDFYKMTDAEAANTLSHAEMSHRTIMAQYLHYKTMYGGAESTFNDLIGEDPTLKDELKKQEGHILHKRVTDLHSKRRSLLDKILGKTTVEVPTTDTKSKKDDPGKEAKKKDKIDAKAKQDEEDATKIAGSERTITAEPEVKDVKAELEKEEE
jgi:hypothetical protein